MAATISDAIGPRVRTAVVAMDRSVELVVAIVAVLRLGATYCPIEPSEPIHRRRMMLSEAGADVLITTRHGLSWRDETDLPVVDVLLRGRKFSPTRHRSGHSGNTAAYLLFTSGSTGKPKGVLGGHAPIVTRLAWMNEHYPLDTDDVFVLKTATTFVDSVWDIVHPLSTGHGLVVLQADEVRDPASFLRRLTEEGVTRLSIVPSHLAVLLTTFPDLGRYLPTVRLLDVTGEAFTADLLERTLAAFPDDVVVLNRYGTTEVPSALVFDARHYRRALHGDQVPIGRAITGSRAWIEMDGTLHVPRPGLRGELCLSGAQLARGYRDPELTGQRFVHLRTETGGIHRAYRTGDLITAADDHAVCFDGRADWQVQLGGRRVDVQEVEAALRRHSAITQAVVVPHGQAPTRTLAAIFTASEAIDSRSLRTHLLNDLPSYMIPTVLRRVEVLPTLPSGKTDRLAAATVVHDPAAETGSGEVADMVAGLVPGIPISPDDRLLSLGFDSLLAMRLVAELRQRWGCDLSPGFVFGCTIKDLTAAVTESGSAANGGAATARPPLERRDGRSAPMSLQQELFHRIDDLVGEDRHAYHDMWTVRLTGRLRAEALLASVEYLASLHPVFRTRLWIRSGVPTQEIMAEPVVDAEFQDLAGLTDTAADTRISEITTAAKQDRYDLAAGESLRVRLLRLSDDQHLLAFGTHHITNDAWSGRLLNRSLTTIYRALCDNREPPAGDEEHTYADYARWQRDALRAGVFDNQLTYWTKKLAGVSPALPLRTDQTDAVEPRHLGGTASRNLPLGLQHAVRLAAAEAGVGEFAYYLAAYSVLVANELSDQDEVIIGSPTALRQYAGLMDTVGFFANMLVYRIAVDHPVAIGEHMRRVNEVCLRALTNQEAPFLTVLQRLGLGEAGPHPVTNVTFAMPNVNERFGEAIGIPGVLARPDTTVALPAMSKFDFSLSVHTARPPGRLVALYRDHLFRRSTVEALLARYIEVLQEFLHNPQGHLIRAKTTVLTPSSVEAR